MKTRISTHEFSKKFNLLRQASLQGCYTMKELVTLFKAAGIYHTPRFIKKLIDEGILLSQENIYTFTVQPVYYKRFEGILDWYYNTNKEYKERCKLNKEQKENTVKTEEKTTSLTLKQVSTGIFFSDELINAIRVCKENGLKVSLSV